MNDRWSTFTDREIDILYTALTEYRRDLVKGIQNEAYEVTQEMIRELIYGDRKGN